MDGSNKELIATLRLEGIQHEGVLQAMAQVDRAKFVEESMLPFAYADEALPIEEKQTISQPYVVASMTELVLGERQRLKSVLEIGTGSGYQAAVLAHLADQVYTIERIKTLYDQALTRLRRLGCTNIHVFYGDGYLGLTQYAPFDAILITAALSEVPQQLLLQLNRNHGRLVAPVGQTGSWQELQLIERNQDKFTMGSFGSVAFVPMLPGVKEK